jgi:hypothetical protein
MWELYVVSISTLRTLNVSFSFINFSFIEIKSCQ